LRTISWEAAALQHCHRYPTLVDCKLIEVALTDLQASCFQAKFWISFLKSSKDKYFKNKTWASKNVTIILICMYLFRLLIKEAKRASKIVVIILICMYLFRLLVKEANKR